MTRRIFLCLTLIAIVFSIRVEADYVGYTDDPMVIGGGARSLGMGRAFAAIADDADALFINPAGIANLKGPVGMAMFTNFLMGEVYYTEFCGAIPSAWGTVGVGYISTGVSQIPTVVNSIEVNTDYYDSLFLLSYSTPLARFFGYGRNIFMGLNFKIFSRGWSGGINEEALGMSGDLGLKFIVNPYLSFGLCRQNFVPVSLGGVLRWTSGAEEALAGITKVGIAIKPIAFRKKLIIDFDADLPASSGRPITMHLGAEWKANEILALRCGLDQSIDANVASKATWNPAVGISLGQGGFRFDYAYHSYYNNPELATSYISFAYEGSPWMALKGRPSPLPVSPRRGR